jgi:hypothetical protein
MGAVTTERPLPTGEGLTFEKVWAMFQEASRKAQETDQIVKENALQIKETDRQMKENERILTEKFNKTERYIKNLGKQMGLLNNRFGELAEHLVAPSIAGKFNEMGFHFDSVAPGGEKILGANKRVIAQVDIVLRNSDYIVAVEVKTKPVIEDVPEHVERLGILREYWDKKGDRRKLCGAIAGAIFPETVREAALKAGLYVLVQSGDTMKIDIPEGFVPREWGG